MFFLSHISHSRRLKISYIWPALKLETRRKPHKMCLISLSLAVWNRTMLLINYISHFFCAFTHSDFGASWLFLGRCSRKSLNIYSQHTICMHNLNRFLRASFIAEFVFFLNFSIPNYHVLIKISRTFDHSWKDRVLSVCMDNIREVFRVSTCSSKQHLLQ